MKKFNQKGVAHIQLIAIALVVAGLVGFAGWRVWQSRQINASASNYAIVGQHKAGSAVYDIKACRKRGLIRTPYGNYEEIRLMIERKSSSGIKSKWELRTANQFGQIQDSKSTDLYINTSLKGPITMYYNQGNSTSQGYFNVKSSMSYTNTQNTYGSAPGTQFSNIEFSSEKAWCRY